MSGTIPLAKLNLHCVNNGHPKFKVKVQIPDAHKYGHWQTVGNLSMSRSELHALVTMLEMGARFPQQRSLSCTGNEAEAALTAAVDARRARQDARPERYTTLVTKQEETLNPADETPNERRTRQAFRESAPVEPHVAEYYNFLYGNGSKK